MHYIDDTGPTDKGGRRTIEKDWNEVTHKCVTIKKDSPLKTLEFQSFCLQVQFGVPVNCEAEKVMFLNNNNTQKKKRR